MRESASATGIPAGGRPRRARARRLLRVVALVLAGLLTLAVLAATITTSHLVPAPIGTQAADDRLNTALSRTLSDDITGTTAAVATMDGAGWQGAAGDLDPDSSYSIASVTKMFTAAVVAQLVDEGRLGLDDRLVDRSALDLTGLHTLAGIDHTSEITIRHLLFQTSGLPDYYTSGGPGGDGVAGELARGQDVTVDIDDVVSRTRELDALAAPGVETHYSDANFELLAAFVSEVERTGYAGVLERRVLGPLGLTDTWLCGTRAPGCPALRLGEESLRIPRFLASQPGSGGLISTTTDQAAFARAFFGGDLFSAQLLDVMTTTASYGPPGSGLQYGSSQSRV